MVALGIICIALGVALAARMRILGHVGRAFFYAAYLTLLGAVIGLVGMVIVALAGV